MIHAVHFICEGQGAELLRGGGYVILFSSRLTDRYLNEHTS